MKIFVVIPAYNAEDRVGLAIASALDQTNAAVEVVVVDHGSSDDTKRIARSFEIFGAVKVVSLIRSQNERRSASRPLNEGIQHVLREVVNSAQHWILRLDADDFLVSASCISSLLSHARGRRLVIGSLAFFDEYEGIAETYTVRPSCRTKDALLKAAAYSVPHHASLIRLDLLRDVIEKRGYAFDQNIGYGEDFDLTLELLKECAEDDFCFADELVLYKKLDGHTVSRTSSLLSIARDHLQIFRRHQMMFGELVLRSLADIVLRLLNLENSSLRIKYGYPGRRWASMRKVAVQLALARQEELKTRYSRS